MQFGRNRLQPQKKVGQPVKRAELQMVDGVEGVEKQFHRAGVAEGRLTEVRGGERLSRGVEHASGAGQIVAAEAGGGPQDFVGIAWQRREGIGGEDDPALGAHEAVEEAFACLAGRQEVEVDEGNGAVAGRQLEPQLSADGLPLVGRAMLGENREVVGGHFAERGCSGERTEVDDLVGRGASAQ